MSELTWRRQWAPTLSACPWQPLLGNYFVKSILTDSKSVQVLITDCATFWSETISEQVMKQRIKTLNPSIEAPLQKILTHIESVFRDNDKSTKLDVHMKGDILKLKISSEFAGMPFSFVFEMMKSEEEMGRTQLIQPLMSMVGELYRQQGELLKILAAKDREIDDYRAQGAKPTRKHMQTTPFDVVAFKNNMVTSKEFETSVQTDGSQAFSPPGQDLYREMATKRAWLEAQRLGYHEEDSIKHDGATMETCPSKSGDPSIESWANRLPPSVGNRPSAAISPSKSSAASSPASSRPSSTDVTPVKDSELLRRQALERRLEEEENKHQEKAKKKKKLKF